MSLCLKAFLHIRFFFFSMEINCNIINKGEQLLIYLVRPITKREKITQYNMNKHKNVLV